MSATMTPTTSMTSTTSQEESFYGWHRTSEEAVEASRDIEEECEGRKSSEEQELSLGRLSDVGRVSLADTIPLEDAFSDFRVGDGGVDTDGGSRLKSYEGRMEFAFPVDGVSGGDISGGVPQGRDTPVVPKVGSLSSGTRSVGSGGSQSTRSQGRKESQHRGSLESEEYGGRASGMERRVSGASGRGSLALERVDARANRSSFDAFQKALQEQVCA